MAPSSRLQAETILAIDRGYNEYAGFGQLTRDQRNQPLISHKMSFGTGVEFRLFSQESASAPADRPGGLLHRFLGRTPDGGGYRNRTDMRLLSEVFESSKYARKQLIIYVLERRGKELWKKMCKFRLFYEDQPRPRLTTLGDHLHWFWWSGKGLEFDLVA